MSLDPQPPAAGPQVGADEWVARQAHRREYLPSWLGTAQRRFERIGWWPRLAIVGLAGVALPLIGLGGFQLQVGIDTLVIVLLALGLNIVVGWAGLLDLGYVAFFGFGAYGFALLSSSQMGHGIHLPTYLSVPIVMIGAAVLGLLVGWPSRRLIGDYLAIVTLFFGEAFVEFTNNVAPSVLGGPNGIVGIDPIRIFGHQLTTNTGYYYLLVILARADDGGAAAARHLAHRAGLAGRARGPAGGGVDDDPGQPGEADGVRVRRRGRGAGRHHLRRAADQRVPDRLRHADPDPRLRRADPRRRRQHRRRGHRRPGGHGHLRRAAAQPDRFRLPLLRPDPADAGGQAAPVAQAGRGPRRDRRARLRRARDRRGRSRPARWRAGRSRPAGSAPRCATG